MLVSKLMLSMSEPTNNMAQTSSPVNNVLERIRIWIIWAICQGSGRMALRTTVQYLCGFGIQEAVATDAVCEI